MAAKRCPKCNLVNPATAMSCDCGWSFVNNAMGARPDGARDEQAQQDARRSWANRQIAVGALFLVIGIVVTAATYSSASKSGGTYTIAYGAILVGVIKIVRGLLRLQRDR